MTSMSPDADHGGPRLRDNAVGTTDVVFTSIANQSPGTSVALNFSFAVLFAGAALPLSLVVALIGTLVLASTVVQFSRRLSSAGGFGYWVARGLSPRWGLVTSWTAAFYGLLFPAETTVIMGTVLHNQLAAVNINLPWWFYNVALLAIVTSIAYAGVRGSARVAIVLGVVEITIFVILGILLVSKGSTHNSISVFIPSTGIIGLTWGLIYGFLSFSGFESVASLGAEAKNPHRTIGRSAFLAVLGVGVFLVFLGYAGVVGWGQNHLTGSGSGALFANDVFPYGTLASRIWQPLHWFILFSVTTSTIAVCLAATNFAARYVLTLSRERVAPSALGHIHRRFQTPSTAILFVFAVSVMLSVILGDLWGPTLAFTFLATAFTFGWIFMFAFANAALPFFYRRHHPAEYSTVKHVILPIIGTVLLIPAFVSPLLPLLPRFKAAGTVAPQIIATIPLVVVWVAIGVVLSYRRYPRHAAETVPGAAPASGPSMA